MTNDLAELEAKAKKLDEEAERLHAIGATAMAEWAESDASFTRREAEKLRKAVS